MTGLKRGTVILIPHDPIWETEGVRTSDMLKRLFGSAAADVQHIGSTAIRGIEAKPIIDIAVGVGDFNDAVMLIPLLEAAGVHHRPDGDDGTQLLFVMGDPGRDNVTHHIHVVIYGGSVWKDYINFRDFMNSHPARAREYETLKKRLAAAYPCDREKYTDGKSGFISYMLRRALAWSYYGSTVTAKIDRPIGYVHKKKTCEFVYPINYGFIPGVLGGDGEELDVYVLGVDKPLSEFTGRVLGAVLRLDDEEDKLIAAPEGMDFTREQIACAVDFQEYRHYTKIELAGDESIEY